MENRGIEPTLETLPTNECVSEQRYKLELKGQLFCSEQFIYWCWAEKFVIRSININVYTGKNPFR